MTVKRTAKTTVTVIGTILAIACGGMWLLSMLGWGVYQVMTP